MHSLRRTFRSLLRRRAYASLSLLLVTLAATAGGATFAIVRATLWRELPYTDPSALVNIVTYEPVTRDSSQLMASSALLLARWRERARTLSAVEGLSPLDVSVSGERDPEYLRGAAVSAGLFGMLGTLPVAGRSFRRDEEAPGSGVVVLGGAVAERLFGSADAALGKTLIADGEPRVIVGVMPRGYSLLFQGGDIWLPLDLSAAQQARTGVRTIAAYGRLRPHTAIDQAAADVGAILRDVASEAPASHANTRAGIRPLREALFGNRGPTMIVVAFGVTLLLLIAVINVSTLAVTDVQARRTQTMTRIALGAGPREVLGTRVAELVVVGSAAGVIAVPLTVIVLAGLASISPESFVPLGGRSLDGGVVVATVVAAFLVTGVGFLPAAVVEMRTDVKGIAGTAARGGSTRKDRRIHHALGAAQAAFTVVLLGIGVLLARDLARLMTAPTGLDADDVFVVRLNVLSRERTTVPERAQYADELARAVAGVPGVQAVSAIQSRFNLNEAMQSAIEVEGFVTQASNQQIFAQIRHVMPNVFGVLGVRVIAGRGIDSTDRAETRPVAVVNRSMANTFWSGEDPIGKRIRRGGSGSPWLDVIGVVEDVTDAGLGVPLGPTFYVSYLQQNTATARVTLVARASQADANLSRLIRDAVWSVNPGQAIDEIAPLQSLLSRTAAQPRFRTAVVGSFAASSVALVLAGVYATTVFSVLARRREFGVRAAIGASPRRLVVLAARSSVNPVLVGGLAGVILTMPAASMTSEIIKSRMGASDLAMSLLAVVLLLLISTLAAMLPARRAGTVPPSEAMRSA